MKDKKKWKSLAAWALAFSMAMGNSGVMVMAESTDAEWVVEESSVDDTETQDVTTSEEAAESEVSVEDNETGAEFEFTSEMETGGFTAADEGTAAFISESTDLTDESATFTDENGAVEDGEGEDGSEEDDEVWEGYFFDVNWPDDDYQMLTNFTEQIEIKILHRWTDENGDWKEEAIDNYDLQLNGDKENPAFDDTLISNVSFEEGDASTLKKVNITSKDQEGEDVEIYLKAVRKLDGENEETLAEDIIRFNISNSYYKITSADPDNSLADLNNPDVGSTVDLPELQVVQVEKNEESQESYKVIENVECRIESLDENIWQLDENADGELPAIRRISPDESSFVINAYIKNENGEEEKICERWFWLDEVEYNIGFEEDWYEFYTDEVRAIQLNKENLNGRNASVDLQIGYTNNQEDWGVDEGFTEFQENDRVKFWSIGSDPDGKNEIITINGEGLAAAYANLSDEYTIIVRALVMAKTGNGDEVVEVAREIVGLGFREPVYEYGLDHYEENHIRVYEDVWVNKNEWCHVENSENLEGNDYLYKITSVEVNNAEGEGDTPVCVVESMEEGWSVVAQRLGAAILTIKYTDLKDKVQTFHGKIYVDTDIYHLEVIYPDNDSRMVVNSEKDIDIKLYHRWAHSETDQGDEFVRNFTLELLPDENGVLFDENRITASVRQDDETKNWVAHIQAKAETDYTTFRVQASIEDKAGNKIPVAQEEIEAEIYDELYVIEGELPENIQLGDYFDINDYKDNLKVMKYSNGEEPEEMPLLNLSMNWDQEEGAWETVADTGKMRRISRDGIGGHICAEFENPDSENNPDKVSRYIFFGNLEYWTWFKDLRQDEFSTFIYDDEEYKLALNDENLKDKKVKVQWEVGYYVGGEEPTFTQIEKNILGDFWSEDNENPFALIIHGNALKTAYEKLREQVGEDSWIDVNAKIITDNDAEKEVDSCSTSILTREAYGNYNYQAEVVQMLPGEEYALENTIYYVEENGEHPYGNTWMLNVQDITLEMNEGEEAPITLEKKGDHWMVTAKSMGHAKAVIAYQDINGNAATWCVEFYVTDAIYFMTAENENRDLWMLNGEELTIPIKAYVQELDENGKLKITEVPKDTYTLSLGEEDYDGNLIREANVDVEDNSLIVKANEDNSGIAEISVRAVSQEQENGEPIWDAYRDFYINVQAAYYTIDPASLTENDQNIGAYESLNLNQYDWSVKFTKTDENGKKITTDCENVRYFLKYDKNQWKCVNDSEELTVPILKRISAAPTWVNLVVQTSRVDAYGNTVWEYAANQGFSFGRIVDWSCDHNWEVTGKKDATCTAEGSITYTCTKCEETKEEPIEKLAHNMVTVTDSEPICGQPGKQHQECSLCHGERKELADIPATGSHDWKVLKTTAATCTAAGSIEYICGICRQTKSESIKKLAHNMVIVTDSEPTCGRPGKQHKECSLCHGEVTQLNDLPATGKHSWGNYVRIAEPTARVEGTEERTCSVCGNKETRAIAKLAPFVKIASTSFPMKKKQTVKLLVTLEKGDSIKTVTSKNTKKLKASVDGNTVTLKAGKKASKGTVKVVITTECGASETITVKLQSGTVQAKKISGIPKKITLKVKKSAILKPTVTPISFQNKITYKSSDSKIASVSKKGVIKAKKAGTATITVTCGKVKVKCKVTVKKK